MPTKSCDGKRRKAFRSPPGTTDCSQEAIREIFLFLCTGVGVRGGTSVPFTVLL